MGLILAPNTKQQLFCSQSVLQTLTKQHGGAELAVIWLG